MISPNHSYSSDQPSGSPQSGEPVFLAVGKLLHPHGVHGEIVMSVVTDFPERIQDGVTLFIGEARLPLRVTRNRWHRQDLLLSFEGYHTPESVGVFRNQIVFVRTEEIPDLPEGEFYHHQLLGMEAFTPQEKLIGSVIDILETGANDVIVIHGETGQDILIPFVDEIVTSVDLRNRRLIIQPIPGLLSEDDT